MRHRKPRARSRSIFKGIALKELFSTPEEWHAFVNGFFEVLCPWPPRQPMAKDYFYRTIENEYHYYLFGRGVGVIAWILIAKLIQVIFW